MDLLAEYEAQDQWRDWDAMLDRLPIARNQTLLDLGCGPGLVSARLAARAANIVGIDRNTEFLSAARQRCPINCTFLEADIKALEKQDILIADGLSDISQITLISMAIVSK
jgi:trans-aconitate methyltransferase